MLVRIVCLTHCFTCRYGPYVQLSIGPDPVPELLDLPDLSFYCHPAADDLRAEYDEGAVPVSVLGRLRQRAAFWAQYCLGADQLEVLDWILYGMPLPWPRGPGGERYACAPRNFPNHASAWREKDFVDGAVPKLVQTGAVARWSDLRKLHPFLPSQPLVISPLSVVVRADGKRRLVIDLRWVNCHLPEIKYFCNSARHLLLISVTC